MSLVIEAVLREMCTAIVASIAAIADQPQLLAFVSALLLRTTGGGVCEIFSYFKDALLQTSENIAKHLAICRGLPTPLQIFKSGVVLYNLVRMGLSLVICISGCGTTGPSFTFHVTRQMRKRHVRQ